MLTSRVGRPANVAVSALEIQVVVQFLDQYLEQGLTAKF